MPSNALSAKKGNPGTPKVCRVPPTPPPTVPPTPGQWYAVPDYKHIRTPAGWNQWFLLEHPNYPPGTIFTITSLHHYWDFNMPQLFENYGNPYLYCEFFGAHGDYVETYTATAPDGQSMTCQLTVECTA